MADHLLLALQLPHPDLLTLSGGLLGLLVIASLTGMLLRRRLTSDSGQAFADNFSSRTRAWWNMCIVFAIAILTGGLGSILLFCLVSFLALREFVTVIYTNRADHRTLFWLFFILTPLQYVLIGVGWYGLFAIFIPVYCFLFVPIRLVLRGDCTDFLARVAKIQWGLMACVYCVSHAPALLQLNLPEWNGSSAALLFFFVFVVEACDVCQYLWGKSFGSRKIVPTVSPGKTWEGFIGGVLSAGVLASALAWATPFTPLQAMAMGVAIGALGFFGDITMSAIKRDANIKDYGAILQGHGGILDRIDSLCFAAPFFFHITRFYFGGADPILF